MVRWMLSEELPPVNINDRFDYRNNISKRLLVWIKIYGAAFGKYNHKIKSWNIEGYSEGYIVTHWSYINKPD